MTSADENRQSGSPGPDLTGGTSVTGSEPATPALGASTSTSMADPSASGISVDDGMTAGSGPDSSMAAPGVGGMAASSTSSGATPTGSTGALGLGTTTSTGSGSTGGMASSGGMAGSGSMGGSSMGGDQSGKLGQVKQQASEQASKLKDQAAEQASRLKGQATDRIRSAAVDGKTRAADKLDGFAQTAHEAAQKIEEQAGPQVGRYAHQAADALDQLSSTLRNKDVDELWNDAQMLMRRSPALAIGAAAAVGFALARFLKASSERMEPNYGASYGSTGYGSEATAAGIDTGYPTSTTTRTNGNGTGTSAYNA